MFDNGPDLTIEFKVCFVRYEILAYLSRIKYVRTVCLTTDWTGDAELCESFYHAYLGEISK